MHMSYESESVSSLEEVKNKTAGKPEISVAGSFDEYIEDGWSGIGGFEEVETDKYESFLNNIGLTPESVSLRIFQGEELYIDVESEYAPNIICHQIFNLSSIDLQCPEMVDMVFVSKTSGKAFDVRSIMYEKTDLVIDPSLKFQSWGGPDLVRMAPMGKNNPPNGIVERGMWNVYKKVEALTLFHEIAHSRQLFDFTNLEESVEAERDAWRFGLQCIRRLRELEIDLLPDVTNQQMISRLELGLLKYDAKHPEDLPRRFSSKMRENTAPGILHDLRHFLRFVGTVLETAKDDPSLISETLWSGEK